MPCLRAWPDSGEDISVFAMVAILKVLVAPLVYCCTILPKADQPRKPSELQSIKTRTCLGVRRGAGEVSTSLGFAVEVGFEGSWHAEYQAGGLDDVSFRRWRWETWASVVLPPLLSLPRGTPSRFVLIGVSSSWAFHILSV